MVVFGNVPSTSSYTKAEYDAILKRVAQSDPTVKKGDFKTKNTIINALIRRGYNTNYLSSGEPSTVYQVRAQNYTDKMAKKAARAAMPKVKITREERARIRAEKQEAKDITATEREFMREEARREKAEAKAAAKAAEKAAKQEARDIAATEREFMRGEAKEAKMQAKKDNRVYPKRFIGPLKPTQSRRMPGAAVDNTGRRTIKQIEKQIELARKQTARIQEQSAKRQQKQAEKEAKMQEREKQKMRMQEKRAMDKEFKKQIAYEKRLQPKQPRPPTIRQIEKQIEAARKQTAKIQEQSAKRQQKQAEKEAKAAAREAERAARQPRVRRAPLVL
jgi:hypothetical protein